MREALADEGEFDPRPAQEIDAEHEDYYARIRAEVGYDDDAFESDAESSGTAQDHRLVNSFPLAIHCVLPRLHFACRCRSNIRARLQPQLQPHLKVCLPSGVSADPDAKYQTVITSPDGRAEIMTLDGDSASEHEAEGDQYLMVILNHDTSTLSPDPFLLQSPARSHMFLRARTVLAEDDGLSFK